MTKGRDLKPHIGIFGRRNTGKSSFINTLVDQDIAIVSAIAGTTTDPVKKSIEIFGIGPAIIIDTAGIDDVGELGQKRIAKSLQAIKTVDCAILMIHEQFGKEETSLIEKFNELEIPFIVIHNKSDLGLIAPEILEELKQYDAPVFEFSCIAKTNKEKIIEALKQCIPESSYVKPSLFKGLIKKNDYVLLVTPIDSEAPEGRMILPQVMAIRDILDKHAIVICLRETELKFFMENSNLKPALVVTDSQAFHYVKEVIPENIPLTSFSIIFARMKGNFPAYLAGTPQIELLNENDHVLILESCTHQVSCEDIGRFKIPDWLQKYTGKKLNFEVVAGLNEIEKEITAYSLVVQCGGCVTTKKQINNRLLPAIKAGIPVTNYGMLIAYVNGILKRATEAIKE